MLLIKLTEIKGNEPRTPNQNRMKILVIRFSAIGDIVLTTPVLRVLKKQIPNAEVHFATKPEFETIVLNNPNVDRVHLLENGLIALIKVLRKEKFDYVVDLHNNLRTSLIKLVLPAPHRSFPKLNIQKWLMVNFKLNRLPKYHIVDRYLSTLQDFGVIPDEEGLEFYIPARDEVELEWLPEPFRQGFYTVVLGAKHQTKKLPEKKLIELCDRINKPIVLLGGTDESDLGVRVEKFFKKTATAETESQLQNDLGKKAIVFNGCGKFNLNQSASLIKQSAAVFTHDTGLMHIAAAFQKKIFSIWGNTIPEFGMYPYKTSFVIFENKKISCRPCSKIGFKKCPKGHFKCMNDIVFDFYLPD